MAKDYPMGVGYRGTTLLSPEYMENDLLTRQEGTRSAHNSFMAVLAEQGFLGASMFLAMVLWVAFTLKNFKAMDRLGLSTSLGVWRTIVGASLTVAFVGGQFSNFHQAEVQYWCLALLAVSYNFAREAMREAVTDKSEERASVGLA